MLKVLIADDEYLVRLGIKETFNWSQFGFTIVAEASDSDEAFEKFIVTQPDIIITDICMGATSGLDLIAKLRDINSESEIIILTGYDEFNYAKKALENGVSAYLLKPIKNAELLAILLKLKNKIEVKKQTKTTLENYNTTLPYFKERFFQDLLDGKITNQSDLTEKLRFFNFNPDIFIYSIAAIQIDSLGTSNENEILTTYLRNTIDYVVCQLTDTYILHYPQKNGNYCLIIYHGCQTNENLHLMKCNNLLQDIKNHFSAISIQAITIGISGFFTNPSYFPTAFEQSKNALAYKSFTENDKIICYKDIPVMDETVHTLSSSDIEIIIQDTKKLDRESVFAKLDRIFSHLERNTNVSVESVRSSLLELIIMVSRAILKNTDDIQKVFGKSLLPDVEIRKQETIHDIVVWTRHFFTMIFDHPMVFRKYSYKREVQEAIKIIMRDYAKPLTIEQVADELFISSFYLMHLFKQELDKTFNEYLTEYRIELACDLLKSQKYKIYEICDKVGYKNTKYFSQLFKKYTNSTPKEYTLLK